MLFLNDWEPQLSIKPSVLLRRLFWFVSTLLVISFAYLCYLVYQTSSFEFWMFLFIPMLISGLTYILWHIWHRDIVLSSPQSLVAIRFHAYPQPTWSMTLNNAQIISELSIKRYFLSSNMMVLHFIQQDVTQNVLQQNVDNSEPNMLKGKTKAGISAPMRKRYSCIILPDQVGEQVFRHLYVCLSLSKKELLSQR